MYTSMSADTVVSLALPLHNKKGVGSIDGRGPFYVEFACSVCIFWVLAVFSSLFSHSQNTFEVHWKLVLPSCVSECG